MESKKLVRATVVLFLMVLLVVLSPTALFSQCNYPNYGSDMTVDGEYMDWNLTNDEFATMYRSGMFSTNPDNHLSTLYLRYDCEAGLMYVLVLVKNYPEDKLLAETTDEIWIKIDGKKVNLSYTFVGLEEDGLQVLDNGIPVVLDVAEGWEGSFPLSEGQFVNFQAHSNVWDQSKYLTEGYSGGNNTSANVPLTLCIICDPIGVELQSFSATTTDDGVFVEWSVASEINHAGYNVYRASAADGEYFRINDTMIGLDPGSSSLEEKRYEYLDADARALPVYYKLEDISLDGQHEWFGPVQASVASDVQGATVKPLEFDLTENYPNPFNPTTTIGFSLPVKSEMRLEIYDIKGTRIRTLVNGEHLAGIFDVTWDGRNDVGEYVTSGIYLYRMSAGDFTKTGRMTLLK